MALGDDHFAIHVSHPKCLTWKSHNNFEIYIECHDTDLGERGEDGEVGWVSFGHENDRRLGMAVYTLTFSSALLLPFRDGHIPPTLLLCVDGGLNQHLR